MAVLLAVACSAGGGPAVPIGPQPFSVPTSATATGTQPTVDLRSLPLIFEPNVGQFNEDVEFLARGQGFTVFLSGQEAVFSLFETNATGRAALRGSSLRTARLWFPHASADRCLAAGERLPGRSHYYVGDPSTWRTDVPQYRTVRCDGLYEGVNLVFHGDQDGRLEYDFVIAPGADAQQVRVRLEGFDESRIDADGNLVHRAGPSQIVQRPPVAYQDLLGNRARVPVAYRLDEEGTVSFELGDYDRASPLVIDPVLSFFTTLGGAAADRSVDIGIDGSGKVYITGNTASVAFPATPDAADTTLDGPLDAFLARLSPDGSTIEYATFLGGDGADIASSLAVDNAGIAVVNGRTDSSDFPSRTSVIEFIDPNDPKNVIFADPFQVGSGGGTDAFLTKFNVDGTINFSSYFGGSDFDEAAGLAVRGDGTIHMSGTTESADLTTVDPAQTDQGGSDVFVVRVNPVGTVLEYSTYLGGSDDESAAAHGLGVGANDRVYIACRTLSDDFPVTATGQGENLSGTSDAAITIINSLGDISRATYWGGSSSEFVNGLAVQGGRVAVVGHTTSSDIPFPAGTSLNGTQDAFVVTFSDDLLSFGFSRYVGGSAHESAFDVTFDLNDDLYVVGETASSDFPTLQAVQPTYGGGLTDSFVLKLPRPDLPLVYSSFMGGTEFDSALGVVVDDGRAAYVAGVTVEGSSGQAFAAKIGPVNAADDAYTTDEDTPLMVNAASGVLANDTDVDGAALTAALVSPPANGSLALNPDGSFDYAPNPDFNGDDTFVYQAEDGAADPATVTITVTPVNDNPVAMDDAAMTLEDVPATVLFVDLLANDTDVDGDMLSISSVQPVSARGGSVATDFGTGTIVYTPPANFNGTDFVTHTVVDGQGGFDLANIDITVTAVNDPPMAVADSVTTDEDVAVVVSVLANDIDVDLAIEGDVLTVASVTQPVNGAATIVGMTQVQYTPDPDFNGSDTFDYTVRDQAGAMSSATVSVTVTPVNDPPMAGPDAYTLDEDTQLQVPVALGVLINDADVDGDPLSAVLTSGAQNGFVVLNPDGSFDYTPNPDFFGPDTFSYAADDGQVSSASVTVTLTVNPVNDLPTADGKLVGTGVNAPFDITLSGQDPDLGDCELTFAIVSTPTLGNLSVASQAMCSVGSPNRDTAVATYTPNLDVRGFDEFTYTVTDGAGGISAPAVVTVVISETGVATLRANTVTSATGTAQLRRDDQAACAGTDLGCQAELALGENLGGNSSAAASARAGQGVLATLARGETTPVVAEECFGARGVGSFVVTDLVFTGPDDPACNPGELQTSLNLHLNGLLTTAAAGGSPPVDFIRGQVRVDLQIDANVFTGAIDEEAVAGSRVQSGILSGLAGTQDAVIPVGPFCVPTGMPVVFFAELSTFALGNLTGTGKTGVADSDFSETVSLPPEGPVFDLPPGADADSPGLQIVDNRWRGAQRVVDIDIRPGVDPNEIECEDLLEGDDETVEVALLSSAGFDATDADPTTVTFEGAFALLGEADDDDDSDDESEDSDEASEEDGGGPQRRDVNGDGLPDLVFTFFLADTTLTCGATQGVLRGSTTAGQTFEGVDSILVTVEDDDDDDDKDEEDEGDDDVSEEDDSAEDSDDD